MRKYIRRGRAFADQAIASPADVLKSQVAAARVHIPAGARWVITAHAFVEGGAPTETERPLTMVGGIETVQAKVFEGASYVALGHLHRAQSAGAPHVRYSGAWMGFGFDEAGETKSLSLVEVDGSGRAHIKPHTLTPRRPMVVIKGKLQELLADGRQWSEQQRQALIKAVLTDEGALVDAIGQLRAIFPYVLQLERGQRVGLQSPLEARVIDIRDPPRVISGFFDFVRGAPPDDDETRIITETLHDLQVEEA